MAYSAKQINEAMQKIHDELDIEFITERHYIQQTYSDIIRPYTETRAGTVRTYGEAVAARKAHAEKYGQKYVEYTQSEYRSRLHSLSKTLGDISVSGAEQSYREKAAQLLESYNDYTGGTVNVFEIDFQTLKSIIDRATEDTGKRSKDRNDSPKLFRNMHHYFEEEGFRNHGEVSEDDF